MTSCASRHVHDSPLYEEPKTGETATILGGFVRTGACESRQFGTDSVDGLEVSRMWSPRASTRVPAGIHTVYVGCIAQSVDPAFGCSDIKESKKFVMRFDAGKTYAVLCDVKGWKSILDLVEIDEKN